MGARLVAIIVDHARQPRPAIAAANDRRGMAFIRRAPVGAAAAKCRRAVRKGEAHCELARRARAEAYAPADSVEVRVRGGDDVDAATAEGE